MASDDKKSSAVLLFMSAEKLGLRPQWLTNKGLFTITTPAGERYITNARSSLNPHVNAGLAKNKFYTRLILERHGLPNIPYARPRTLAEARAFVQLHETVIIKPLRGQGAENIHIVDNVSQLDALNYKGNIFEKYVTGQEMRYLVLNNRVIAVHRSDYGVSVAHDRALDRISYAECSWDSELVQLSLQIARILGLKFAAIDFLVTASGEPFVLEVNTVPGLKWFHAPTSGPPVDVASMFLRALLAEQTA